jgi:hypothetical protein
LFGERDWLEFIFSMLGPEQTEAIYTKDFQLCVQSIVHTLRLCAFAPLRLCVFASLRLCVEFQGPLPFTCGSSGTKFALNGFNP